MSQPNIRILLCPGFLRGHILPAIRTQAPELNAVGTFFLNVANGSPTISLI